MKDIKITYDTYNVEKGINNHLEKWNNDIVAKFGSEYEITEVHVAVSASSFSTLWLRSKNDAIWLVNVLSNVVRIEHFKHEAEMSITYEEELFL